MGIAAEPRRPSPGRRPGFARLLSGATRSRASGRADGRSAQSLLERHGDGLFRYCALMLGSAQAAADCVQVVGERAVSALPQNVRGPALQPRLFRIAHEECMARLERRGPLDEAVIAQAHAGTRSELRQLGADLAALPAEQRSALLLRELNGLHHAGLADALGVSVSDAKRLVEEARQGLEKLSEGRAFAALAGRGDEAVFEVLYDRYRDPLYRYCSGMLGRPEQAEEALQAAMSGAARALAAGGDVRVRNRLVEMAHSEAQRRLADGDGREEPVRWSSDAREGVRSDLRQLAADVDALPGQQRSALVLRELNGLSYGAIGEALGAEPSAVKRLIEEARQGLEAMCEARMRACADMRTRLSDNDRREPRGRADLEHLRSCARCQEFGAALRWRPPQLAALAPPPGSAAVLAAGAAVGAPPLRPRPETGPSRGPAPRPRGGGRGGGGAARRPFPIDPGSRGFRAGLVGLVAIALGAVAVVPGLVGTKNKAQPAAPPIAAAAGLFPERLYVPNGLEGTVDVINPSTFQILERVPVGSGPQHVIPSWDMKRLYVLNTGSNTITQLDPRTGQAVRTIDVPGPDNLYWTIDGKMAVVVGENLGRVDFRDPESFALIKSVAIPGSGPNHLDFSGDGSFMLVTTELDGRAFRIDTKRMAITGQLQFSEGSRPVDVMLIPEAASSPPASGSSGEGGMEGGSAMASQMGYLGTSTEFFVADQGRDGVAVVDAGGPTMRQTAFIPTGRGAHGFGMSHDGRTLYVTNRLGGTVSRIDVATRKVTGTFPVGGSPDMIQVAPDGKTLWTSNRFDGTVTVLDASSGRVIRTITVGAGPHGLCMFPQPARYSTGHCMFR